MRKFILCMLIVMAIVTCSYAADAKTLVIVFSRADENYSVGYITTGNTRILADMIAAKTGAELFELQPATKYPADYETCIDVAKREQNQRARPAILEDKDISEYDTIFLGYPVWWGDVPMCVYTFMEAHDWTGKTVIPFATHEGSGMGSTERTLNRSLKGAKILRGIAIRGSTAQNRRSDAESSINSWLKGLNLGY